MSAAAVVQPAVTQWNIDPTHSDVQFAVKHLGLMTVRGHFEKVSGTATTDNGRLTRFQASIDPASINTRVADRDKHLRSADFLDVEKYPELKFKSTDIQPAAGNSYKVSGDLSIAGQTHPAELEVEITDPIKDPWGFTRSSAVATTKISRKEWGLVWNQVLEAGGFAVGDEVKITIEVEATAA
jgi:polyisoprenoid-binding protein YceI